MEYLSGKSQVMQMVEIGSRLSVLLFDPGGVQSRVTWASDVMGGDVFYAGRVKKVEPQIDVQR